MAPKITNPPYQEHMKVYLGAGIALVSLIYILSFTGCYSDNELDLYGSASCDTTNISYLNDVVPILSANCYICHKSDVALGGITMDNYTLASDLALSGSFLGALKHKSPYSPMPKGGNQLIQCDIDKLESWIRDGTPDN